MDFYLELFDGNYSAALDRLTVIEGDWVDGAMFGRLPKTLLEGQVRELLHESRLATDAYTQALSLSEEAVGRSPEDAQLHSVLAMAYAGLGREEDAVEAGEKALDLAASSAGPLGRGHRAKDLAIIYTRFGKYEAALDLLERVLSEPFDQLTVPLLEFEPMWEPLRDQPRYRELVREYRQGFQPN